MVHLCKQLRLSRLKTLVFYRPCIERERRYQRTLTLRLLCDLRYFRTSGKHIFQINQNPLEYSSSFRNASPMTNHKVRRGAPAMGPRALTRLSRGLKYRVFGNGGLIRWLLKNAGTSFKACECMLRKQYCRGKVTFQL